MTCADLSAATKTGPASPRKTGDGDDDYRRSERRSRSPERWAGEDRYLDGDEGDRYRDDDRRLREGAGTDEGGKDKEKDILDLKILAELKSIFDRFAIEGMMTATETCQALTEAGLIAPRR